MNKYSNRIKILTITIIVYMLAALSWWSVLLLRMNRQLYEFKTATPGSFTMEEIESYFLKQKNMIIGEGLVFGLALVAGIYLLYLNYRKESNLTKRQNNFLLSVTHEFKSPLSALKLIGQTLLNKKLPKEKQAELLQHNEQEIHRLEDLVNNLLASTQLDHDYKANLEKVQLHKFLFNHIQSFKKRWPQEILFSGKENVDAKIDQELFRIAIQNLLDNASKYSPESSGISMELEEQNNEVHIRISDSGLGISQKDQKMVFEKFYRSGDEKTRKAKGTGLGLFLAKEIIDLHNGTISVQSELNKGSTFTILIPNA